MPSIIDIGPSALIALVLGSTLIGVASEALGEGPVRHEWVVTAIGAFAAALVLGSAATIQPSWDGLAVIPALIGGLVGAGVTSVAFRGITYEMAARRSRSITIARHVQAADGPFARRSAPAPGR